MKDVSLWKWGLFDCFLVINFFEGLLVSSILSEVPKKIRTKAFLSISWFSKFVTSSSCSSGGGGSSSRGSSSSNSRVEFCVGWCGAGRFLF